MWNASRGFTIQLVHNDTPIDFPNLSHLFPNLFIFPSLFQFCLPGPLCALETIHTIFTLYPHWFLAFSQLSLSWPSQCVHTFLLVVSTGWKACQASTSFILRSGNRTPFSCTKATVIRNTGNTDPAWNILEPTCFSFVWPNDMWNVECPAGSTSLWISGGNHACRG